VAAVVVQVDGSAHEGGFYAKLGVCAEPQHSDPRQVAAVRQPGGAAAAGAGAGAGAAGKVAAGASGGKAPFP